MGKGRLEPSPVRKEPSLTLAGTQGGLLIFVAWPKFLLWSVVRRADDLISFLSSAVMATVALSDADAL